MDDIHDLAELIAEHLDGFTEDARGDMFWFHFYKTMLGHQIENPRTE